MNGSAPRIPDPKELEREISEFLSKKFGGHVKVLSPVVMAEESPAAVAPETPRRKAKVDFNLKPEELIAYLDQYVVRQDQAKAILATKICTHFNRIRRAQEKPETAETAPGGIKNNVLMIGPTGVGKTYIIKLIASKIGVPFVKGDATKFSETGYVGGDVEDLVRDLVREAGEDLDLAQYGIIYIDEIDKIASARNLVGADVSRTGVQRALLKPMEETDVELRVPHDPVSMMQEIERFRKTGKRERVSVNTRNVLFIMSGAFGDLAPIIQRRLSRQEIGFGARLMSAREQVDILRHVKAEDLIEYGFESEFVGRLPVKAVLDPLGEDDLYQILRNPNNPIILGKKLDFSAYGIDVKFEDAFLRRMAALAFAENTGARGLVSVIEKALLDFERALPSSPVRKLPVTLAVLDDPRATLERMVATPDGPWLLNEFERVADDERAAIRAHLDANRKSLGEKFGPGMTSARLDIVADFCVRNITDTDSAVRRIKDACDEIKNTELRFYRSHAVNMVLEEDAVDFLLEMIGEGAFGVQDVFGKLEGHFEHGLKLVRERTGRNRFFISRAALQNPEEYVRNLITATSAQDTP